MTKGLKPIRIFISSPGDVAEERALTKHVIQRLQGEFSGLATLEPIYWEHEPLLATKSFQEQIIRPSETDIVVTILWSRLGTRLPDKFTRSDGSRYSSGTEFEFEDAINSFRDTGTPDLLIYRKTAEPVVSLKDRQSLLKRISEKEALDNFFNKWFHDEKEGTLVAAFHAFNKSADFEEILESHLRKLIKNRLPDSNIKDSVPAATPQWQEGSPFRGLNVFEFEHSPVFFGRTKAISEIIDSLRKQDVIEKSFIMILGMSGGGKSSLVRAGVLPMLTQPGVIEGVGLWRRAIMKPSDSQGDLFDGLASSLLRENALPELSADRTDVKELAGILRDTPKAAVPLIKGGLSQAASEMAKKDNLSEQPVARLVLVIDQMEELFSLASIKHEQRMKFMEAVDALARSGRVWVITTLRSDFYQRCTELEKLVELKEGTGQYDLLAPTPPEIGQMIRQPAVAAGLHFEENPATNERLDEVLRDAAAKNPAALPLLEFTLEELYKQRSEDSKLTFEAYNKLGGVEGALAQRAEELYKNLSAEVQQVLDVVMHSLVSIGVDEGESVSRKYVPLNIVTNTNDSKIFVEAFIEARLFTTDLAADGSAVVSIAHEALLQHWPRLQEWIGKNRESLRIRTRVASAAKRWIEEDKSNDFLLAAGKAVGEAQELVTNKNIELSETEKLFVDASIAKRKRIWWLKRIVVAALAVLTIVAGGTAYIAEVQRERAETAAKTSEQVSEFLVGLFEVSDPNEALGDTITAREILDKGAERVENELSDQPEIKATLMNTIGVVYKNLGFYEQATLLLENSLVIRKQLYGEKHVDIAESMNNLAIVRKIKGDYEAAEQLYRKALEMRIAILGREHPEVSESLSNFAGLMLEIGDYEKAEMFYREALSLDRKLLGTDHPEVARMLNNLGMVLLKMGDFKEAEALFLESLEKNRKLYGNEHTEVVRILNNLGGLMLESNNYLEAEKFFREALLINRKLLGNEHPHVAWGLNNLGILMLNMGDFEKAEPLLREFISIIRKVFGDNHPAVANGLNNLAGLMLEMGNYSEAEKLFRESLSMRRSIFGNEHPNIANSLSNLGGLLVTVGRYSEAEPLFREAIQVQKKIKDKNDWKTARYMNRLGGCLVKQKRFEEAEPLLLESYPVIEEERGATDKFTLNALNRVIELYESWNKLDKVTEYKALLPDSTNN